MSVYPEPEDDPAADRWLNVTLDGDYVGYLLIELVTCEHGHTHGWIIEDSLKGVGDKIYSDILAAALNAAAACPSLHGARLGVGLGDGVGDLRWIEASVAAGWSVVDIEDGGLLIWASPTT